MSSLWLFFAIIFLCIILCVDAFTFHSPAGFSLDRQTLLAALPTFDPHDYQLDGVCKILNKIDLVTVTPTGSGKTGRCKPGVLA